MAPWVRNGIMVVVMFVWAIYILVTLIRRDEIAQVVWGLPGVIYFALNPTWRKATDSEKKTGDSS